MDLVKFSCLLSAFLLYEYTYNIKENAKLVIIVIFFDYQKIEIWMFRIQYTIVQNPSYSMNLERKRYVPTATGYNYNRSEELLLMSHFLLYRYIAVCCSVFI